MADDYTTASNAAANVRVIKQGAVFLFKTGTDGWTAPTGTDWEPPTGSTPIGYFSEDGTTLHPEAGDETEIKGHNGDTVYYDRSGGYFTLQVVGLECKQNVLNAYFDVTPDATTGAYHLADASTGTAWEVVVAGVDQNDKKILIHLENAIVSDRGDIQNIYTDAVKLDITFRARKGATTHQMLHIYGLALDVSF